ncbi:MAG: hypothetical protein NVS1B7_0630 [Candidatus Saccharimonadales bacterium]
MLTLFAYVATFLSASCYSLGSVLQQIGIKRVKPMTNLKPLGLFQLVRQAPYAVGLLFDGIAFSLFLVVTHIMPLYFVQSVESCGIAVTAILSHFLLRKRLKPIDLKLITVIVIGLILISFSASPETAQPTGPILKMVMIALSVVIIVVATTLTRFIKNNAMLAASMAGLSFSGVAICSRMLVGALTPVGVLTNPLSYALLIYAALGLTLFSMALQNGLVTHVDAATFVVEIIIPTTVGLIFLGDHPRNGLEPFMIVGLIIVVCSIIALALSHTRYERREKATENKFVS